MTTDMFDEFSAAEQALTVEQEHHGHALKAAAIARKTSRLIVRRAKSEAVLARQTPIETLLISTWCMAMPDVEWLRSQIEVGRIGHIDFIIGEIFPSQYPDEYTAVGAMESAGVASMKIARNHAKVMAGPTPDGDIHFAIESSSNVNTNPRIEQTAIHMSRELCDHYRNFYAGIKSIDGSRYRKDKSK